MATLFLFAYAIDYNRHLCYNVKGLKYLTNKEHWMKRQSAGGGRSLNVRIDNTLLIMLIEGWAAWLREHPHTGWHDYLRMVWGVGAEALAWGMKESQELAGLVEGERL